MRASSELHEPRFPAIDEIVAPSRGSLRPSTLSCSSRGFKISCTLRTNDLKVIKVPIHRRFKLSIETIFKLRFLRSILWI